MRKKIMALAASLMLTAMLSAGLAMARVNPDPAKDKQLEAVVNQAVELIKAKGEAAIEQLRQPGQMGDLFVCGEDGMELVNTADPSLVGQNVSDHKTADGRSVVSLQAELIKTQGAGWIDVPWTRPGQNAASMTHTYVKGVELGGKTLIVGSWYYLN